MIEAIETYGLVMLFLAILLESAGVPLPGETGLITASMLASRGHLDITSVILFAAVAAIVGDSVGYWGGRLGGRRVLYRWPVVAAYADRVVPPTERFFQLHGGKTVFAARFITGLRVAGAWIAGATRMDWWRFLCWNAAGGIAWAAGIGFLTYYLGRTTTDLLGHYGLIVGGVADVAAALVGLHLVLRHLRPGHRVAPASARPAR